MLWKALFVVSADERVLAEPLCSAKASAAGVRQQRAAPVYLRIMCGVKETVDFRKKTHGGVILSGDHANFSICSPALPKQQCQALAQGCPRDCDMNGDIIISAQPRWSNLSFSQGVGTLTSHSSGIEGTQATVPPRVLISGCIQKSVYIDGINHHLEFCSWMQLGKASWNFWESNSKEEVAKLRVWFMGFCNAHQHNSQQTDQ